MEPVKVQNEFYDVMTLEDVYTYYEKWGYDIILGNGDVDAKAMEDADLERKRALAAGTA